MFLYQIGSQPVSHISFVGQIILLQGLHNTIQKHKHLHCDSQQKKNHSYEVAMKIKFLLGVTTT